MKNLFNSKSKIKSQVKPQLKAATICGCALLLNTTLINQVQAKHTLATQIPEKQVTLAVIDSLATDNVKQAQFITDATWDPTYVCRIEPWNCIKP